MLSAGSASMSNSRTFSMGTTTVLPSRSPRRCLRSVKRMKVIPMNHVQLVAWAILKRDKNNQNARQALGYRYDGRNWVKGNEAIDVPRAKTRVQLKMELERDGFVMRKNRWFATRD